MNSRKIEIGPFGLGAVVLVSFVVGAATVWITEGVSWRLPGTESGSQADWLAAYGTWMIGIAATFVAMLTYLYTREQARGIRLALLSSARLATADALWLEIEMNRFFDRSEERQKWRHLTKMLKVCHARSERIKIDSAALPYVPHEASKKLVLINNRLYALRTLIDSEAWIEPEGKCDEFIGEEVLEGLKELYSFVQEIDQHCDDFSQILTQAISSRT